MTTKQEQPQTKDKQTIAAAGTASQKTTKTTIIRSTKRLSEPIRNVDMLCFLFGRYVYLFGAVCIFLLIVSMNVYFDSFMRFICIIM